MIMILQVQLRSRVWRGPAQDVPFFYTRYHFSELPSCKSIISTVFLLLSFLNSARHISVIELCREPIIF